MKQRAAELDLNDAEVARRAEISARRYSNYVNEKREPDYKLLLKICKILETSPDYILGTKVKFDILNNQHKNKPKSNIKRSDIYYSEIVIQELDVRASGGSGSNQEPLASEEIVVSEWHLPKRLVQGQTTASANKLKIITVYGDSMEPDFCPGDRVLVDTEDRAPSPPGVFVVWDGFGLVIKRLEMVPYSKPPTVRLVSMKQDQYEPREIPADEVVINGRVIGRWQWT